MDSDTINGLLARLTGGDDTLMLVGQVFLVVFAVAVANFFLRRALARLEARSLQTATPWDNAFVAALRRPLTVLAWVVGISFAARIVHAQTGATIFEAVGPARTVGVIACIAWFLVLFIRNVEQGVVAHKLARGEPVDRTTVEALGKLLRVSVLITAALVGLQSLGFSISGVLAFGGIGGVAVGFAAKDLLANFFGALMVYLDRPFIVGDWIRSPDKEIEGTVEEIGWRLTRIRTFDKRPLYVPNSVFTQITVENASRMTNRRIYETVGVRYADLHQVAAIVEGIRTMLRSHPEIDQDQTMIVNFSQFAASSLDIMVYTFTKTTAWVRFHEIKQDVLLRIAEVIEANGAQIAFPTRTVNLPEGLRLSAAIHPEAATADVPRRAAPAQARGHL